MPRHRRFDKRRAPPPPEALAILRGEPMPEGGNPFSDLHYRSCDGRPRGVDNTTLRGIYDSLTPEELDEYDLPAEWPWPGRTCPPL